MGSHFSSVSNLSPGSNPRFFFSSGIYAQRTPLARASDDILDQSFSTQIKTANYIPKSVDVILPSDGKIVARRRSSPGIARLNANGTDDTTFSPVQQIVFGAALRADGAIVMSNSTNPFTVTRALPNGAPDPSFAAYSQQGVTIYFGQSTDVPLRDVDYNGDGKADVAIRRGEIWALLLSVQGCTGINFGSADDQPVAAVNRN